MVANNQEEVRIKKSECTVGQKFSGHTQLTKDEAESYSDVSFPSLYLRRRKYLVFLWSIFLSGSIVVSDDHRVEK
jgi:hypothetical protein